jgi:hypothetical protein
VAATKLAALNDPSLNDFIRLTMGLFASMLTLIESLVVSQGNQPAQVTQLQDLKDRHDQLISKSPVAAAP